MECAKILLHPQQFGELDKYIKGKWAMGSQSDSVSEMGADRRRHLQAVVGALVLKILDCAKGGKADQAGALVVALKNKGLKELYEQCEKDVANCHPASDWQHCSIVSNIIKTYKVALQCNRRLDARQALSYFFSRATSQRGQGRASCEVTGCRQKRPR